MTDPGFSAHCGLVHTSVYDLMLTLEIVQSFHYLGREEGREGGREGRKEGEREGEGVGERERGRDGGEGK